MIILFSYCRFPRYYCNKRLNRVSLNQVVPFNMAQTLSTPTAITQKLEGRRNKNSKKTKKKIRRKKALVSLAWEPRFEKYLPLPFVTNKLYRACHNCKTGFYVELQFNCPRYVEVEGHHNSNFCLLRPVHIGRGSGCLQEHGSQNNEVRVAGFLNLKSLSLQQGGLGGSRETLGNLQNWDLCRVRGEIWAGWLWHDALRQTRQQRIQVVHTG